MHTLRERLEWPAMLQVILDRVPAGFHVLHLPQADDPSSFVFVYGNAAFEERMRVASGLAAGKRALDVLPGLTAERLAVYAQVIGEGEARDLGDHERQGDGATPGWCAVQAIPLPHACVGVFHVDISAARAAEQRLRDDQRFLVSVLENIPHMVFMKDAAELRFVGLNKAGEELLGVERAQLIGKNDFDVFPESEARFFTQKDRDVLDGGALVDIPREPIHTTTRGLRQLHTKKVPLLDTSGRPAFLLGISEDITDRLATEDALQQRTEELARSNADLEQFAYVASHDLQEPLRKIVTFGDRLKAAAGDSLPEVAADSLERMQSAARRMRQLIDDLLHYARVTTLARPFESVELGAVVAEVLGDLEHRVESSGGRVEVEPLPALDMDRVQMRQLVQNLLANALKFARPGVPPVVRVSAVLTPERSPSRCELRVADNGIGFDEKYLTRLFAPFQRLHGRSEYEGTGMGLAICRKIAERHGGTITARSAPDEGTTFIVSLPLRQPRTGRAR